MSVPVFASVEEDAAKIVDLFYNLQFDQAIAAAKTLESGHPDHPAGYFFESVAYYQRYLLEDPPRPETFKTFLALSQATLEKAIQLMPTSPAISRYYQGAALGFQARAYVSQKKYGSAIPKARQGSTHLKKALMLDPSLEDANLGMGMYYYFLDRVPMAAKPFAYLLMGMKGDRQKGLALLERVAQKGRTARMEAKSVLAAIYASEKEKRWDEALLLYKELMENYPHNPRYRLKLVYVMQREGFWDTAVEVMDAEGPWIGKLDPLVRSRAQVLARYRTVENLLFAGRYPEASAALDRLESSHPSGLLRDWTALRRGNYWDAVGQSGKAKNYYEKIKDKKASSLVEMFIQTHFPNGPRDVMPNRWPISSVPE